MASIRDHDSDSDECAFGVPRAEDGRILESIRGNAWTAYVPHPPWAPSFASSAETAFWLPVDAAVIYFVSRGSHHHGNIKVTQSATTTTTRQEEQKEERAGQVRVDVRVAYHDPRALARATVCRLRKSGHRHGVGVYTPIPSCVHARDRLYVEVVLTFPAAISERDPVRVRAFTTHAANFVHEIGDLWRSLSFDTMNLDASNAAIHATSVTLTRGTLSSSNGAIVGHFNASESLTLRTSNARIQATASLFDDGRGRDGARLDMQTSNGTVTSSISLATPTHTGGSFAVMARTSNGAIDVTYEDAPDGSRLVSDARTSNGAACVTMHPSFVGAFEVGTSNARGVVRERQAGRGRRRVVQRNVGRGRVEGRVWMAEGGVEGASRVYTSNAQACLDL